MKRLCGSGAGRGLLVLAGLAVFMAAGCGGSAGTVSGTVKYDGRPLPLGSITFLGQGGENRVLHADIVDGKYTISGAQVGPNKVIVNVPAAPTGQAPPGPSGQPVATAPVDPSKFVQIPTRYGDPQQSGLTCDVKSGSQTQNFDLTP